MTLTRKDIFSKAWLWSLVGSILLVAIFWIISGFVGALKGNIVRFTIALLIVSLVGDVLGASLIAWRVADKYYHQHLHQSLRRYVKFSLLSLVVAVGLLFTPFSLLVGFWSLVSAWCVMLALENKSQKKT